MIEHNGIQVQFVIDDTDILEYSVDKHLTQSKVMCWIPSETGKEFKLMVTNKRQSECSVTVRADGNFASHPLVKPDLTRNVAYYRESASVTRGLTFAKLDLVDDDDLLNNSDHHLGEIEVECWDIEVLGPSIPYFGKAFPENKRVHERSKKGIGQHVSLGTAVTTHQHFLDIRQTDHIVTFVFHYRPLDYLRAQGIAPPILPQPRATPIMAGTVIGGHDPSPSGSGQGGRQARSKTKEEYIEISEDEDNNEIKDLPTRVEERRAQKRKRKDSQDPRKKVKKEASPLRVLSNEIIDLT